MAELLVIDDDPDLASMLKATLEAFGHEVAVGYSVSDAYNMVRESDPDLLLIDLGLPDGDGKDVVRDLRITDDVPIIVVTSRYEVDERVAALDAGADDFVLKPFSVNELAARVRAQLRRSAASAGPQDELRFGDLEIDVPARQVRHGGVPIRFTPTEFQMLILLARRAGQLVSHNDLYREVWPDGSAESGHYVRVYIQQIRRKLQDDVNNARFIATEHSHGYRWLPSPTNGLIGSS